MTATQLATRRRRTTTRDHRLPILGVQISVLSAALGFQFFQGFTAGNVVQLLALALMAPAFRLLRRSDTLVLIAMWSGLIASTVPLALLANVTPQWLQIAYFALCFLQVAVSIRLAPHIDLRATIRTPVNLSAFILAGTAAVQFATVRTGLYDLYFDDKSHAAVSAFLLSFLVVWVNRGVGRFFLAFAVMAAGVLTASRLVLLGVPILLVAVIVEYRRTRREARDPWSVYLHHLALVGIPAVAAAIAMSPLARGLTGRLSVADSAATNSTLAHVELARMSLQMKVADPLIALFGVGPGSFGPGVRVMGIAPGSLPYYDPGAFGSVMRGFAPIHSANLTMLVEYPVWVAAAFVALWVAIVRRLWVAREGTLACMAIGMLVVTTLYSTHNEYLYWAYLSVLCLAAFSKPVGRRSGSARQAESPGMS